MTNEFKNSPDTSRENRKEGQLSQRSNAGLSEFEEKLLRDEFARLEEQQSPNFGQIANESFARQLAERENAARKRGLDGKALAEYMHGQEFCLLEVVKEGITKELQANERAKDIQALEVSVIWKEVSPSTYSWKMIGSFNYKGQTLKVVRNALGEVEYDPEIWGMCKYEGLEPQEIQNDLQLYFTELLVPKCNAAWLRLKGLAERDFLGYAKKEKTNSTSTIKPSEKEQKESLIDGWIARLLMRSGEPRQRIWTDEVHRDPIYGPMDEQKLRDQYEHLINDQSSGDRTAELIETQKKELKNQIVAFDIAKDVKHFQVHTGWSEDQDSPSDIWCWVLTAEIDYQGKKILFERVAPGKVKIKPSETIKVEDIGELENELRPYLEKILIPKSEEYWARAQVDFKNDFTKGTHWRPRAWKKGTPIPAPKEKSSTIKSEKPKPTMKPDTLTPVIEKKNGESIKAGQVKPPSPEALARAKEVEDIALGRVQVEYVPPKKKEIEVKEPDQPRRRPVSDDAGRIEL